MSKFQKQHKAGSMTTEPEGRSGSDEPLLVVGIGVPEGAEKSLEEIFSGVFSGQNPAFILVRHFNHPNVDEIKELLGEKTQFPVVEAENGMLVTSDKIIVMPPKKLLSIAENKLSILEHTECDALPMPIDHFFCSLAADKKELACGILLAGAGSDGVMGLSEIKAGRGYTILEESEDAEVSENTRKVVEAGLADEVLPAKAIPNSIEALVRRISEKRKRKACSSDIKPELAAILDILRSGTGHDFSLYKPGTLERRIRRRMVFANLATYEEYAGYLNEHPDEIHLLQKDLFIGVTEFFRQSAAWEELEKNVVIPLVEKASQGSELRAWIPGCSTGKEVYSLAMLFDEAIERSGKDISFQFFATDSDAAAIEIARNGTYTDGDLGCEISPERQKRFFKYQEGQYRIKKKIRKQIVFAVHNLLADPPFSRLDLISCRNLLIYIDQKVQRKVIELFHFTLGESGFLFLGSAENALDREDLFKPVSKKWRIYQRIGTGRRSANELISYHSSDAQQAKRPHTPAGKLSGMSFAAIARQTLLERFAPACVMIDRKLRVLYLNGDVENYLTLPSGELTTYVIDMARDGLKNRLRGAIAKSMEDNRPVSFTAGVFRGGKMQPVKSTVSPLKYPIEADGLILITFEEYCAHSKTAADMSFSESNVSQLENELKMTREELHGTIEYLENLNERFKAANEEAETSNEELQSSNEELETSREELQSLNEELNTANVQLQEKIEDLERANDDVNNLLESTHIATVFLDRELKVKRYTPAIVNLFSLIPSDFGRPIADILKKFDDNDLTDDAAKVLANLTPIAKEVQAGQNQWYIRRVTPYRTKDDRIDGVVITFADITVLKRSEKALREAKDNLEIRVLERTSELEAANSKLIKEIADRKRAEQAVKDERKRLYDVLETIPAYLVLLDEDYHVPFANRYFRECFGESNGKRCFEYLFGRSEPCEICETYTVLKTMQPHEWEWTGPDGRDYQVHDFPFIDTDGSTLIMEMGIDITDLNKASNELLLHKEHLEELVLKRTAELERKNEQLAEEITERKKAETSLRHAKKEWELTFKSIPDPIAILDDDHGIMRVNPAMAGLLGCTPDQCAGMKCHTAVHGTDSPPAFCPHTQTLIDGKEHSAEIYEARLGRHFLVTTTPVCDENGKMTGSVHVARDITELKQKEERIKSVALFPEENPYPVLRVSWDGTILYANRASASLLEHWLSDDGMTVPEPVQEKVQSALTDGKNQEMQIRCDMRDLSLVLAPMLERGYVNFYGRDITKLKRAETSLMESSNQLRTIIENLAEGLVVADMDGNMIHWNRKALEMHGLESVDKLCCHLSDFIGIFELSDMEGNILPFDQWPFVRIFRGENPGILEACILRTDKSWKRIYSYGGGLVYNDLNQPFLAVVSISDITERKNFEEALRKSKVDLNRAQAVASTGSWRLGLESNRLLWSDETYRIFGIPEGTPITYDIFMASLHPDDRNYVDRQWREALDGGVPYDIEHRIVAGDTVKWVRERAELEFDKEGNLTGGFGTIQDITKRKYSDTLLQESLRRFELLSRIAGDLLQCSDQQEVVEILCQKVMKHLDCQAFFNFLADDTANRLHLNAYSGITSEEAEKIEWLDYGVAVCGCVAQQGCRIVSEHIPTTDDPRTELVKSYGIKAYACHPLLGAKGNVIGTLSFGTKTRETFSEDELALMKAVADQVAIAMVRIRHEHALWNSKEALLKANTLLEQKVNERTANLSETVKALRNEIRDKVLTEEELKSANQELENMTNQLRILAGELTMAEQRERKRMATILHDDLQQQLALAKIQVSCLNATDKDKFFTSIKNIENLLSQAINVSRTLTSELSPPILFESGLKASLEWLARWEEAKYGLKISLTSEENIPELEEDVKIMLFSATRELLFNTIKHAKVDSAVVELSRTKDGSLRITVSDSGMGFDISKIKSAGEAGAGYGLLSIRERLHFFGGNLDIDSAPGRGSRFIMAIPVAPAKPEPQTVSVETNGAPGSEISADSQKTGGQIRVLIVDDHAMMREGLAGMLNLEPDIEVAGHAQNGYEAIEKAGVLMPDVILMDISMPVLNGISATQVINEKYPDICIIGLSMYEEDESAEAMLKAGAACYLTKSGPRSQLIATIRNCMKRQDIGGI